MMPTVPHVISGLGLRKFQADGFLLTRVYILYGEMLLARHRNLVASLAILGLASASSVFFITYGFPCLVLLETLVHYKL